eukprot:2391105-Amphidinium_carterae.1
MDQKTKLIQEAVGSRDALREELVEVYLRVRRLPKEELPLPKEAPRVPASFAVPESLNFLWPLPRRERTMATKTQG